MPHADITAHLHKTFPLAHYMQIAVTTWNHNTLALSAPLAPNINHTDTAFGGSISALAILAGYTLLHLALEDRKIPSRILIQKSATDFLRPIETALTATASLPAAEPLAEFLAALVKKRKGRITLTSEVLTQKTPAATHTGLYVAILY